MRLKSFLAFAILILTVTVSQSFGLGENSFTNAKWIWHSYDIEPNSWAEFESDFYSETDSEQFIANIAVDSKYWLYLNDSLIIREGALKRGPTPYDTYYDQLLIDKGLKKGSNKIKILVWYWGVDGSSHKSSGKPGLIFELKNKKGETINKSDESWLSRGVKAYRPTTISIFNNRNILSEWPIKYDASYIDKEPLKPAVKFGDINCSPWNRLIKRPIPFWKDSELKSYSNIVSCPVKFDKDTIIRCWLPYNMQVYPYIRLISNSGKEIGIKVERDWKNNTYITADGAQHYEVQAWGNGHFVDYAIPANVEILDLKYRETSYDTEIAGSFKCSDNDLNILWTKSARSTILNMRDNYMDCPDRERSQWTHDAVNISEFSYYALDRKADLLTRKMITEFINWRTPEGILWGAVPTGRFLGKYREFATSPLIGISAGIYEYFVQTGDSSIILQSYEPIRKYLLEVWEMEDNGLVKHRGPWETAWDPGTQNWNDWGSADQDWYLLENCWYYLSLKRAELFAEMAGKSDDIPQYLKRMKSIEKAFDNYFWQNDGYRSPNYNGRTDDRGNALSIYSGLASVEKWDKIAILLSEKKMASIYFEKYVLEALYIAGKPGIAYKRLKNRYQHEIKSVYTTMPENFGEDSNHGWGGAPLLIASKYIAGIAPLTPGYNQFSIKPQMGELNFLNTTVSTVKGNITLEIKRGKRQSTIKVSVPKGTSAKVEIPSDIIPNDSVSEILLNGRKVIADKSKDAKYCVGLEEGEWILELK